MSRKAIYGKCRICGEYKKLTFEHVPPETTFNNHTVKILTGDKLINGIANENKLPWELGQEKGIIQQRGRGGHFLCGDCNSKTGQWYVPEYSRFVNAIHYVIQQVEKPEYGALGIKMQDVRPLPIFKQIMTMFCDINNGLMGDDSLKEYLLNKTNVKFRRERYHLFVYIHSGEVERMNGIMAQLGKYGIVMITEISTYPIGFALYINKPESYKPQGVEITTFSEFEYDDKCDLEIIIPKLESNIIFSGDYRSKSEILDCIEENKKL